MANKRFIVRHGLDNSGDNSVVNTITNVAEPVNNSDAATKYYVDTHVTGGTVTSVTATSPVESTGGTTPVISLGTGANGQLVIGTGTGFTKSTLTAGTGVSIANASGSITISATGSGGDVVGPASATDNAVTRFDSTTGKLIQNSTVTLDDNGNFGNVNSVVLDNTPATLPTGAGTMYWEDGEGTAEVILKGGNTTLKVGTQEYARVYNDSGSTITLGQVVYISGAQGNRIAVKLAQANTEANSFGTLGLVAETIANGAEGWVIVSGALYKLNTLGLTAGAVVYLSPTTAGAYTTTKPQAPDQLVVLGFIERVSSTVGSIYVKVDNGYELDELHDVRITSPVSGNTLIYDATTSPTGVWKNASLTAGTGISVTNGAGSITIGNTGVTSVSGTSPVVSSGGATPAISLASGYGDTQNPYGSKTANYFLASPNGTAGSPTFRAIVAADIPTLNQSTTGNAATASALQTARNINGVSFNGTADITVTAAANTLTGTTLASGVTASSLTSVGTLTGLTVSGTTSLATSSGSVGIGTASPASRLMISGTGTGAWFTINRTDSGSNIIDFTQSGSRLGYVGYNGNDLYLNQASAANTIFFTNNTERMRIDSSGNVGIGVTPLSKLDVNGVITLRDSALTGSGRAEITSTAFVGITMASGNYVFNNATNTTEYARLTSTGLGIGTSSPSAKLDVNGQVRAAYASGFQVDNAGTMLGKLYYSGGLILDRAASTSLFIAQNGSNQVTLDSSGNLGLGTSSPTQKIMLGGQTGATSTPLALQFSADWSNGYVAEKCKIYLYNGGGTGLWGFAIGPDNDIQYHSGGAGNTNGQHKWYTGNTETMRLNASGNLGIGVANPSKKLQVNGGDIYLSTAGSSIWFAATSDSGDRLRLHQSGGNAYIDWGGGTIYFRSGASSSTARMDISGSGVVTAAGMFCGNSGAKGFGSVTTTTSTSTPTGGSSGDHYYIY